MLHIAILGAQWGDEGKGKISDYLSSSFDVACRFNGGDNAAHTVIHDGQPVKFRCLPAAALNAKTVLLSAHVVIDPARLIAEVEQLKKIRGEFNLLIDYRTHLVLPYHLAMDEFYERWRGDLPIRSMKRGIGPCHADRTDRLGIRTGELLDLPKLRQKLERLVPLKTQILDGLEMPARCTPESVLAGLASYSTWLAPWIGDANQFFRENSTRLSFLFEGAQGALLDNSYGFYPFVAGYGTTSAAIFPSLGVPAFPTHLVGVASAYTTQIGNSPFPTDQTGESGRLLQLHGNESSLVGLRRCGWLDLVLLKYSTDINGFSELALTKLDVLDEFASIPVCVGYQLDGKTLDRPPADLALFEECRPIYKVLPGWRCSTKTTRVYEDLPPQARGYIEFIENNIQVPIRIISTGPERDHTILRAPAPL